MSYCCEKCFGNQHIKDFIECEDAKGDCDYCGSKNVFIVSIEHIGTFIRSCIPKAYENLDDGTGAYYDSEYKEYYGSKGKEAIRYSVMNILEDELVFSDEPNEQLAEDIFNASGPSFRDEKHGEYDPYGDIFDDCFVIRNDLEGVYSTKAYFTWEHFKFAIKHYNRFFDVDAGTSDTDFRKQILDDMRPVSYTHLDVYKRQQ